MRKRIRLTEGDIRRIVKHSVRKILKENDMRMVYAALLNAGLRDVTDVPTIKGYLTKSLANDIERKGETMTWLLTVGDRTFMPTRSFRDEDIAAADCDRYIKLLNGTPFEASVEGIFIDDETQDLDMDTLLVNEDGEWYD